MKPILLDALRSLRGRKNATLVAAGGLTLAMAACLLLALIAIALATPDPGVPDPEQVVMLDFKGNPPGRPSPWFNASPVSFGPMLKARKVPLDLISRAIGDGLDIQNQGHLQPAYMIMADPDLVPLLGLKALEGDLHAALTRRDGVAITTDLVRKLWGELPLAQALGRRIESRGTFYTVTAVIPNTDPRSPLATQTAPAVGEAMVMVGYDSQANYLKEADRDAIYRVNGRVFARLRPGTSVDQVGGWMRDAFVANPLYAQLPAEWKAGREAAFFRGLRLTDLPFNGETNALRWQLIGVVAAASLLLLLLAAFNTMNLQTASLLQRQRETALRHSLGANHAQLLRLWALEVLLPLLFSAASALLLAWWLAPAVATWMDIPPSYPVADPLPLDAVLGLVAAVLVLLPLTLALPAWAALRRPAAPALQGRTASEGAMGTPGQASLLALQLGGAFLLLSLSGVMAMQQYHMLHVDRGFDTQNRLWVGVMVNPEQVPNMEPFLAALSRHPAVKHWAFSNSRPARDTEGQSELHVSESQHKQVLRLTVVSPSFFETYGMTLLAGRPQADSGEPHIVIDAKAARLLGFANPQAAIGAQLRGGGGYLQEGTELRRVVAVVKDVSLESARDPAQPQGFLLTEKPQWDLTLHGEDLTVLRQVVDELWKAHGPALLYEMQSADEQHANVYRLEDKLTTMLAAVALLAVSVAMLGAYALVADTLRRRRTELVLHRLHGAGHLDIARQVAAEFAWPLLVATVVGLLLATLLGQEYLAGFVDRIGNGAGLVLPLAVACALIVLITVLAASRHVRQALTLQPIEALQ